MLELVMAFQNVIPYTASRGTILILGLNASSYPIRLYPSFKMQNNGMCKPTGNSKQFCKPVKLFALRMYALQIIYGYFYFHPMFYTSAK